MPAKKLTILLLVVLVMLLLAVSLAQASPNTQQVGTETPQATDDSLGETITPTVKYNLGAVMSGKVTPVASPDPLEPVAQHPVASALANFFGVTYDEVFGLHEAGNGFGNIAKAYFFAEVIGVTPADLLDQAHGAGWGNVLKENGLHPGSVGQGVTPGKDTVDQETDAVHGPDMAAPGNQSDKDKNNNGRGNGQDKPNKPDKDKNKGQGKKPN